MRAIVIDPFTRTIEEVEVDRGIQAIYDHIGASCFICASMSLTGPTMYVDDEGLLKAGQEFFAYRRLYPQPLAGKCLILDTDDEGESIDCSLPLDQVREEVRFGPPMELLSYCES